MVNSLQYALDSNRNSAQASTNIQQLVRNLKETSDRLKFQANNCDQYESSDTCTARIAWEDAKKDYHEDAKNIKQKYKDYVSTIKNKQSLKDNIGNDAQVKIDERINEIDFFYNSYVLNNSDKNLNLLTDKLDILLNKNIIYGMENEKDDSKWKDINDNLTIKRRSYYTSKQIEFLYLINNFISYFYWGLVVFFIYAIIIIPKNYTNKKLLSIMALLIIYPYLINSIYDIINMLIHGIFTNLGFNFGKKRSEFIEN